MPSREFGRCSTLPDSNLYNAQFMDHVAHPYYKYEMEDPTYTHEGVNPSCGDDLVLQIKIGEDGTIEEASYTGHGCAISQASADMMSDLMIDRTPEDALRLCGLFMDMVRGDQTDPEVLAELDEASMLESISRMPARVKCAELAWRTLEEIIKEQHMGEGAEGRAADADEGVDAAVAGGEQGSED